MPTRRRRRRCAAAGQTRPPRVAIVALAPVVLAAATLTGARRPRGRRREHLRQHCRQQAHEVALVARRRLQARRERLGEEPRRELRLRDAVRAHELVRQPDEERPVLVHELDVPAVARPPQADAPPVHVIHVMVGAPQRERLCAQERVDLGPRRPWPDGGGQGHMLMLLVGCGVGPPRLKYYAYHPSARRRAAAAANHSMVCPAARPLPNPGPPPHAAAPTNHSMVSPTARPRKRARAAAHINHCMVCPRGAADANPLRTSGAPLAHAGARTQAHTRPACLRAPTRAPACPSTPTSSPARPRTPPRAPVARVSETSPSTRVTSPNLYRFRGGATTLTLRNETFRKVSRERWGGKGRGGSKK